MGVKVATVHVGVKVTTVNTVLKWQAPPAGWRSCGCAWSSRQRCPCPVRSSPHGTAAGGRCQRTWWRGTAASPASLPPPGTHTHDAISSHSWYTHTHTQMHTHTNAHTHKHCQQVKEAVHWPCLCRPWPCSGTPPTWPEPAHQTSALQNNPLHLSAFSTHFLNTHLFLNTPLLPCLPLNPCLPPPLGSEQWSHQTFFEPVWHLYTAVYTTSRASSNHPAPFPV